MFFFSCQRAGGFFRMSVGGEKYWSRQWGNWEMDIFCASGMAAGSFRGGNTAVMTFFEVKEGWGSVCG